MLCLISLVNQKSIYTKLNCENVRIRLVFSLNNRGGSVPFHHQHLLGSLIKEVVAESGKEFTDYEFYNFSGLKGQTKISREGLHFYSSKVTLVLSSPNKFFIDYLLNQIFERDILQIGQLYLSPYSIEAEQNPEFGEAVKYVCISPLVLTDPLLDSYYAKKFISPEEDAFSDLLYESTMARMERSKQYTDKEIATFYKFQLVPDKIYLKRIKEQEKKFARIYTLHHQQVKCEVRGYTFPFLLYAAPQVQEFIYECGLGAYSYHGFGMIDFASPDPIKHTTSYEPTQSK